MRRPAAARRHAPLAASVAAVAVAAAVLCAHTALPASAVGRRILSERPQDVPVEPPARPTDAPIKPLRPTEAPAAPTKSPSVAPTKSPTRATPRPSASPTAPSDSCVGFCNDFAPSGCSCRANCVPADPPVPIDLIPVERLTPSEGDEELPIAMPTRPSPFTAAPTAGGEQCCLDACEVRAALLWA